MCNHDNSRVIKTTGAYFIRQCLDCGHKWQVDKQVVKTKKTLLKRILRR